MKNIASLIPDIYSVLQKGGVRIDTNKLSLMLANRIERIKETGDALRMSSLGERCHRKLWYKKWRSDKADPLAGNTLLTFLIGDIIEEVVLSLAEATGHTVEGRQEKLELEGVPGHRDAIIDGVLVDVKSANSRSIDKFRYHKLDQDDPFGYRTQLDAYLEASKGDPRVKIRGEAAFLAADKELGHLVLDRYPRQEIDWKKIIQEIRTVLDSPTPPKRAYLPVTDGLSGNMQLPLPCRYCQYKTECWKDSNGGRGLRKFIYSNGPRWLVHVEKEPKVNEEMVKEGAEEEGRPSLEDAL